VEIDSIDMVKRYVELGLGVAIGHSIALDPGDARHLGIVKLSGFLPSELVGIVTSKRRRLPDAAQEFIGVLRTAVRGTELAPFMRPPARRGVTGKT
jgi:DNA-binding transcriptional LysR family regulator